ncbi:hypothetical protein BCR34DRAFT_603467 [Clohesyomyces aquaticus]|uniref:Uncharacterized protein n=1 Tax=Clohesyomyces aquaticus TaxID=1231657 RepID=A0A1Y1ZEG4_9PLEO|nr:hypothetical protein BCR34DRAFT_603467 [Clohesyomyces aquaticus]
MFQNPRLLDWQNPPNLKENRLGVYLHLSLPRHCRIGISRVDGKESENPSDTEDPVQPVFPQVPNRWLVVRYLRHQNPPNQIPQFQSWVIESDRLRRINEIPDDVDLEVDVSPFVAYDGDPDDPTALENQAEVFIGKQNMHSGWPDQGGWTEDFSPEAKFFDLTIMNSSNPLFQNGGVFSMIDSFVYMEKTATSLAKKHLQGAEADYYVLGWYSNPTKDPLTQVDGSTLNDRLKRLLLEVESSKKGENSQNILSHPDPTRELLYGSMYQVTYDRNQKPRSMADEAATKFGPDVKMEPLSLGNTPLESVLTFLEAHQKDTDKIFGPSTSEVTKDLLSISSLLYSADDSYDSLVKAQDRLLANNFSSSGGGSLWAFDGKATSGQAVALPTHEQANHLLNLNEAQARLDASNFKFRDARWSLFAEWWKYVSDRSNANASSKDDYLRKVNELKQAIQNLEAHGKTQESVVDGVSRNVPCKKAPRPGFYQRNDPTLCIAGMDSGWPDDFLDIFRVRLNSQVFKDAEFSLDGTSYKNITDLTRAVFGSSGNPIPGNMGLDQTAAAILFECVQRTSDLSRDPSKTSMFRNGAQSFGNTNSFAPLFVEWEATYFHIDQTKWSAGLRPSPRGHSHTGVRFGVNDALWKDPSNLVDKRLIRGRQIILPQPIFSLESAVMDLLYNAGQSIPLSDKEKQEIKDNIRKLKFVCFQLAGPTEHLLTRCMGTHVKPNVRV